MDEDRGKRVRDEMGEDDWLIKLPESLLCHVLSNLRTKDVVKTSILSRKWRDVWRYVPGLDLDCAHFKEYNDVVSFIDRFLSFNSESCLRKFKLRYDCVLNKDVDGDEETDNANVMRWINTVVKRKVQHLNVSWGCVEIPPTLYVCESLVSLELAAVVLPNPEFVSLPSVKVIVLDFVKFANDLAIEKLISGCLVLERLTLCRSYNDGVNVLRVSSQSLLSFEYKGSTNMGPEYDDLVVEIDAPKLELLMLSHRLTASFIIKNPSSLVNVGLNIEFNFSFGKKFDPNDLPKRDMIRNFFVGISGVKNLFISPCLLEVIYDYSRCEQLPLFRNLSILSVDFYDHRWEILPIILESCPNLKSLVVESKKFPKERSIILSGPRCLLSSLEYVEIESPLEGDEMEMKLVSYLLENSPILKKLTLSLSDNSIEEKESVLKELVKFRRSSSSCQVIVLRSSLTKIQGCL